MDLPEHRPLLPPAPVAVERAEDQQGIDMASVPTHARSLKPSLPDLFVPALDRAAAQGWVLGSELGLAHLLPALGQVLDMLLKGGTPTRPPT